MHIKVSQNDPNLNTWLAIQCQLCLSNFQCSVSHKSNSHYQAHTLYRYGHGKQIIILILLPSELWNTAASKKIKNTI